MIKFRGDGSKVVQDWVEDYFQPSLRDWSSFKCNPGLTSWAKFSRPFGTEFGNGVLTHALKPKSLSFFQARLKSCPQHKTKHSLQSSFVCSRGILFSLEEVL